MLTTPRSVFPLWTSCLLNLRLENWGAHLVCNRCFWCSVPKSSFLSPYSLPQVESVPRHLDWKSCYHPWPAAVPQAPPTASDPSVFKTHSDPGPCLQPHCSAVVCAPSFLTFSPDSRLPHWNLCSMDLTAISPRTKAPVQVHLFGSYNLNNLLSFPMFWVLRL